jgi:thiamine pyrophosphate-dependent acetolactate synthase large subunit-like protein
MRASDLIVQCLENEPVHYVFGLPGQDPGHLSDLSPA